MSWTTLPRSDLTPRLTGYRAGNGPRLLLVHGVGMRAEFWDSVLPELERRFTVTAVDLPGHVDSPRLAGASPTLSDYGDVLVEMLQESPEPSFVVGHSLGALLALDIACRHTPHVAGIGVLNGVYRRSTEAKEAVQRRVAELAGESRTDSSATLERWFGKAPDGVAAQAAEACHTWLASIDRAGYRAAYQAFADSDAPSDHELSGMRIPALVMTGSLEPNSTPAMATCLSAVLPDAHCLIVDGARHMMPMTHGDIVCRALVERFGGRGEA